MGSGFRALAQALAKDPTLLIAPLIVFAIAFAIGYLVRAVLLRPAARVECAHFQPAKGLADRRDAGPDFTLILIFSVHLAIQFSDLPPKFTTWAPEVLLVLFILSLTVMCVRIAGDVVAILRRSGPRSASGQHIDADAGAVGCGDPGIP